MANEMNNIKIYLFLLLLFMACNYTTIIMPTEEYPDFELAGTSYWQLQHEGE